MVLSILLFICGIMLGVSAGILSQQKLLKEFKPAAEYRTIVTNLVIMTSCVSIVVALWGVATFKVTHRVFTTIYGLGVSALTIILTWFTFIFWTFANLDISSMYGPCPGSRI